LLCVVLQQVFIHVLFRFLYASAIDISCQYIYLQSVIHSLPVECSADGLPSIE
jgi:hypothetical protein